MSLYDYDASCRIARECYPFYALLMAAMRQADSDNIEKLKAAWPEVCDEFTARYHAPGGFLAGELPVLACVPPHQEDR